ncbi:MAG: trypsin-like peptidase domain-containing protein [Rhodobacteraceae bacterium]|nr:trypsin-like peptidase domain-containing protein [Paracoccaceae bacterium]
MLATADETRGLEAVGRIDIGQTGFCTGTLIAPDRVLTAAHCLYDNATGKPYPVSAFRFMAGLRNGRAAAYRGVRRAMAHPDYDFSAADRAVRVTYDLALLQLDQPIRLPSLPPFAAGGDPLKGESVAILSYGIDRSEAPSLENNCQILGRQPGVFVMSCLVEFGSSGAPVFQMRDGKPAIVSVVSAKAEMDGRPVALGATLEQPLAELEVAFAQGDGQFRTVAKGLGFGAGRSDGTGPGGAKFLKP